MDSGMDSARTLRGGNSEGKKIGCDRKDLIVAVKLWRHLMFLWLFLCFKSSLMHQNAAVLFDCEAPGRFEDFISSRRREMMTGSDFLVEEQLIFSWDSL